VRIRAADFGARDQGIDVAIGEHDEPGAQGGESVAP